MTIALKTFPTFKQLYRNIYQELLAYEAKTLAAQKQKENTKLTAYYSYLKSVAQRDGKPVDDINSKLESLKKSKLQESPSSTSSDVSNQPAELQDLSTLHNIIGDKVGINSSYELNNLNNVATFLKNQREYFELLVRYNPGLLMDQQENVSKTANRVGLDVPE
ncbi:hypothetical protein KGF57_003634 [Candida theae]|uniref:ATP synthase assembly factor FMC1, mitochondrial n=1 Tax=Candida theae TaxID=1198502 RepID=A0AAD5FXJ7_9ASCO|nr:uncharacterized protein KGF57_003634 [Candida theae]KAI5955502.1 hypothetical protein KGF57_003634 [Candida theae]